MNDKLLLNNLDNNLLKFILSFVGININNLAVLRTSVKT